MVEAPLRKESPVRKFCSRCYLRGTSRLGLFNTIVGCLFNCVLARRVDTDTRETVGWFWDKATKWPKVQKEKKRKCLLFHNFETVRDTRATLYLECLRCELRIARQNPCGGHQPVDQGWLNTGEWTKVGNPPRVDSSVTTAPSVETGC